MDTFALNADAPDGTPRTDDRRPPGARGADDAALRRLAGMFTAEPELVRAFLQDIERQPANKARAVFTAAALAVEQCPQYADLLRYAAEAAVAARELDTAAELVQRALAVNSEYRDALILAGRIELLSGRPEQATRPLERALRDGAAYPDVYVLLGDAYRAQENFARARAAYERALALNPNLAAAHAGLAALPAPRARGEQRNGKKP
jgi:tetratricopeptide (TPR) repeat protein